jgi:HK97 family phage portal protein
MSILDRVRAYFRAETVSSADIKRGDGIWEVFTGLFGGAPTERTALQVTAVHACVNLISGALASLPMHVYLRATDGDLTRDMNNPLWWLLNEEFCARWSAAAGWSYLAASRMLHGDAFAEILRGRNGQVQGLVPLHPNRVQVLATSDGLRLVYVIQPDPTIQNPQGGAAKVRVIDQDDMLHVPGFGFDGLNGQSALKFSLSVSGRLAISAQNFSSNFLQNMARPDFALKTDKTLTPVQWGELRQELAQRQGPMNAGRPMVLEGGLDIKTLTMPLEEMQLLDTRKFQVEEIARAFNVPPFMIGHTEKTSSWGAGVEAMGAGFARYTLRDHLNAFQNEINRKFFRTARYCAEFDTTELERADTKKMFEAARIAIGRAGEAALMTLEEVRVMLRLPKKMVGTIPVNPGPAKPDPEKPDADEDEPKEGEEE